MKVKIFLNSSFVALDFKIVFVSFDDYFNSYFFKTVFSQSTYSVVFFQSTTHHSYILSLSSKTQNTTVYPVQYHKHITFLMRKLSHTDTKLHWRLSVCYASTQPLWKKVPACMNDFISLLFMFDFYWTKLVCRWYRCVEWTSANVC